MFWAHVSFEKRGTEVHLSESEEKYCNIFFVSSVNDLDL